MFDKFSVDPTMGGAFIGNPHGNDFEETVDELDDLMDVRIAFDLDGMPFIFEK